MIKFIHSLSGLVLFCARPLGDLDSLAAQRALDEYKAHIERKHKDIMEGEREDQRQIIWRGYGVENRKAVICVTEVDDVDVTEGPS